MTHHNRFEVEGNLTRDAELTYTNSGTARATFSIANEVYCGKDRPTHTSFFNFTIWGSYAEKMTPWLIKGTTVFVTCQGRMEAWEKDGKKMTAFKCIVGPSDILRFTSKSVEAAGRHQQLMANKKGATQHPSSSPATPPKQNNFEDDIPF